MKSEQGFIARFAFTYKHVSHGFWSARLRSWLAVVAPREHVKLFGVIPHPIRAGLYESQKYDCIDLCRCCLYRGDGGGILIYEWLWL